MRNLLDGIMLDSAQTFIPYGCPRREAEALLAEHGVIVETEPTQEDSPWNQTTSSAFRNNFLRKRTARAGQSGIEGLPRAKAFEKHLNDAYGPDMDDKPDERLYDGAVERAKSRRRMSWPLRVEFLRPKEATKYTSILKLSAPIQDATGQGA